MRFGRDDAATLKASGPRPPEANPYSGPGAFAPGKLAAATLLAVSYYAGVHTGIALTFEPSPVSTVWPPNAIVLAALLLTPPREWWLLLAAVLPAHLVAQLSSGVPLTMTLCWFVSNMAEALLGAALMLHFLGRTPRFDRVADLSVFLIVGVLLAPIASSFLDASFVALAGWRYSGNYWEIWYIRLLSNALAMLTLVPLIVIGFQRGFRSLRNAPLLEHVESGVLLTGIGVTSAMAFLSTPDTGTLVLLMYAPLPFLMWAAVRRGVGGVSLCAALLALFTIIGVLRGRGPFASAAPENAVLTVQIFLIIVESSLMLLAASLAELRRTRRAALRQEESLNVALGAARMEAWVWDMTSDRITWRPRRRRTANADHSHPWESMAALLNQVHVDDRAAVRQAIESALESGAGAEVEIEYRVIDGESDVRWITSKGKVVVDARGKPKRMFGVHMDTTDRKRQETQTRQQREQLTHLSRVSTLGALSGAIAHELTQPLTAILNNAQAAQWQLRSPRPNLGELDEILAEIVSEDKRAGEVIRRLRTLFMRGTVQTGQVDANECITEALRLQHSDLMSRNVITDVQLGRDVPLIAADPVELQQVMLNLIVNACDAMAENDPWDRRLRIVSACNAEGGIDMQVCDNGHGMDDVEMIFEPFHTTKDHGIGLGLSICRTIVTAHGGRLWARNNAGRGATLHVVLPARSSESATPGGWHQGNSATNSLPAPGPSLKARTCPP